MPTSWLASSPTQREHRVGEVAGQRITKRQVAPAHCWHGLQEVALRLQRLLIARSVMSISVLLV
jgi:hypothetical protein